MQRRPFLARALFERRRAAPVRGPLPRTLRAGLLVSALFSMAAIVTGCAADKQYSQTELATLQSREFEASYEATYNAAINALFDAGYTIRSSDRDAGFVAASRTQGNAWSGFQFHGVQVKIGPAGSRTTVRISNTDGMGQQQVNKEVIDELLDLIARRLIGEPAGASSDARSPAPSVRGQPLKGPDR